MLAASFRATGALCLTLSALTAQGTNAQMLAHVDKFPGAVAPTNHYAGIWGMVVGGKEYALVGARSGTIVYDCSDPKNPKETGFIPGPGPSGSTGYFWREINSYGNYAYVASEHGAMQVIDMNNPAAPTLAGTFGSRAHTVSVDQDTGYLWSNGGAARGSWIYDLNANPTNPPQVNSYQNGYVHDCLPIRGHAYLAHINAGTFEIVDTTNINSLKSLSSTSTPGNFTHNVWVTADDRTAITADENSGGCLAVFDITNKNAPVLKGTWCSPNGATVHNVFIRGRVAHFSSYSDGYWAVDITDPANPKPVAQYDTTPLAGSGYHGCWGCYPFQPSGAVYLADMQTGFWIVQPTCGVPNEYGAGTAGTGGIVPRLEHGGGAPQVGNAGFQLVGSQIVGGTNAMLAIGPASTQQVVLGVDLLVDLMQAVTISTAVGGTPGVGGAGSATFGLPIPAAVALANDTFYAQVVAVDTGGALGLLSATHGLRFSICP